MNYGLYIHFPFCVHKCFYCDFYSLENLNLIDKFVDSLLKEIDIISSDFTQKPVIDTIFFGGGTPSLINPLNIEKIFYKINNNFNLSNDIEITLECNPGTIDVKYFSDYKKFGINRISFGVQSFIVEELKFLERIHSVEEIHKAFDIARNVGFDNINLDLIFSLPNQPLNNWKYNLEQAIALEPNHISAYSLIYEENTPLYSHYKKGKVKKNSSDQDVEFYDLTTELLNNANFEQYEVSNYAKNNLYCKHNLKYWNSEEYFAFGPSAVGILQNLRYKNHSSLSKYNKLIKNSQRPIEFTEELTKDIRIFERIFLTLRARGLNIKQFSEEFNINLLKKGEKIIEQFIKNGFMLIKDNTLKLTPKGYFVGDDITLKLMDAIEQ